MSLYGIIAAGHQGQCFAHLSRKFLISEPQAAVAVRYLLPVVLPSLETWISTPGGMAEFLDSMSRGGHDKTLRSPAIFNNHFERDRGMQQLEQLRKAREFDVASIAEAADASGLTYRVLLQLLPWIVLLAMSAVRQASEAPCRAILSARLGANRKPASDPFGQLAELIAWESKNDRPGTLANMLSTLFRRPPTPTAAAHPA